MPLKYKNTIFQNTFLAKSIISFPGDVSIFALDKEYRYIIFNKKYEDYLKATFGIKVKVGDSIIETFKDFQDINKEKNNFDRALNGVSFSQVGNYKENNKTLYYKDIYKPIYNNDKNVIGLVVYYTNITTRKKTEKVWEVLLNISEKVSNNQSLTKFIEYIRNELARIIDTTNFFVALYNHKNKTYNFPYFIDKYDKIEDLKNYDFSKSLTDYVRRTGKPIIISIKKKKELVGTGIIESIGTMSPSWLGIPLKTKGKIIGVLVAQNYEKEDVYSSKDVNLMAFIAGHIAHAVDQKQKEKQLEETINKLHYAQTIAKMGHWEIDKNTQLVNLSKEARQILGFEINTQPIKLDDIKKIISKKDIDTFNRILKRNFEKEVIEFDLKINLEKKALYVHTKYKISGSKIRATIQDITIQHKDKLELKKAKEKAEESDKLKSAFLANMSHEIRTPMNAIVGFSKLMARQNLSQDKKERYVKYINDGAENLMKLINDIIDVAKIEAEQLTIIKKPTNVNEILSEIKYSTIEQLKALGKENVKIILENKKESEFYIHTDTLRFRQIVINLIGNAIKFTNKGYIKLGYTVNGKMLEFYIEDTGNGIPDDKKELIFSRFGQIIEDEIVHPGGTGLGLSITKHLVNKLGGKIWLQSEYGKGTTFYFSLPNESAEKQNIKIKKSENKFDINKIQNLKILIVEDNYANRILIEDLIISNTKNNIIDFAETGKIAIMKFFNNKYDIVFMDIKLPDINGYEVTENIREYEKKNNLEKTPIVGLSAHAMKEFKIKCKNSGMNSFISKPFKFDKFFYTIYKYTVDRNLDIQETAPKAILSADFKYIDLSLLEPLYKGNGEKFRNIINLYIETIQANLDKLRENLKENKVEKIEHVAHTLKSSFAYLGMQEASEKSRNIEKNSNETEEFLNCKFSEITELWKHAKKEAEEFIS